MRQRFSRFAWASFAADGLRSAVGRANMGQKRRGRAESKVSRIVSLTNVSLVRDGRVILNDVTWTVRSGEHWALLGRNGSGKTTILEIVNGYLFPSRGTVEVLGHRYGACDVREVRKSIGYVGSSLFDKLSPRDPVWEVVATGAYAWLRFYQAVPSDVESRARSMLALHRMDRFADLPFGTLSQGERKKVMIARALMQNPSLLVLDEPCAGLDLYEREQLLEMVSSLADEPLTVLYVTHHLEEIVPMITHVALIDEGRIVAAGPKREVLTPEAVASVFRVPARIVWEDGRPWVRVGQGKVAAR